MFTYTMSASAMSLILRHTILSLSASLSLFAYFQISFKNAFRTDYDI